MCISESVCRGTFQVREARARGSEPYALDVVTPWAAQSLNNLCHCGSTFSRIICRTDTVNLCSNIEKIPECFPKWQHHFIIPSACFMLPISLQLPDGSVVKNLPAKTGDAVSISGL